MRIQHLSPSQLRGLLIFLLQEEVSRINLVKNNTYELANHYANAEFVTGSVKPREHTNAVVYNPIPIDSQLCPQGYTVYRVSMSKAIWNTKESDKEILERDRKTREMTVKDFGGFQSGYYLKTKPRWRFILVAPRSDMDAEKIDLTLIGVRYLFNHGLLANAPKDVEIWGSNIMRREALKKEHEIKHRLSTQGGLLHE